VEKTARPERTCAPGGPVNPVIVMKYQRQQLRTGPIRQSGCVSLDYAIIGTTVFAITLAVALGSSTKSLLIQFALWLAGQ